MKSNIIYIIRNGVYMNEHKKVFSKIAFNYLLLALIPIFFQIIISNIIALWDINQLHNGNNQIIISSACNYILVLPIFIYLMRKIDSTDIDKEKLSIQTIAKYFCVALTLMWAGNLIGLGITALIGHATTSEIINPIEHLIQNTNIYVNAIIVVMLAPIFEELFFRKLLIDRTIKYGAKLSILLSALLFALFHGNLNQFFYAFFIGGFFAYVYIKTGNIKYSIVLHGFVNFLGSVVSVFVTSSAQNLVKGMSMANTGDIAIIGGYALILAVAWIVGLIAILTNYNKIELNDSAREIFLEKPFSTVMINIGMICFIIFHIFKIIKSLNLI